MARTVIIGVNKHNTRLKRMYSAASQEKIGRIVYAAADKVRVEARRLIADGAIQGKNHVPSLPGEPPNWDTGELANGIETTRGPKKMQASTDSTAPHSDPLESGTSKMAARPFMRPAAQNVREEVVNDVANGVNELIRKK